MMPTQPIGIAAQARTDTQVLSLKRSQRRELNFSKNVRARDPQFRVEFGAVGEHAFRAP